MFRLVVVCALVATAIAVPVQEQQTSLFDQAYDLYSSCSQEADIAVCLKLKALGVVDRVARSAQIEVVPGLKIVQNEDSKSRADNARSLNDIEASLPAELEAREAAIDDALVDRAARFLSTHTLEVKVPEEFSAVAEGRGKKKKKQIIESLKSALSLLKLKALLLIPIAIIGFKLLVIKAVVLSKIALVLSAILAFKKFFGNKHESVEIVSHDAHHDDHHGGYSGGYPSSSGWGRGLDLAYNAYKPKTE